MQQERRPDARWNWNAYLGLFLAYWRLPKKRFNNFYNQDMVSTNKSRGKFTIRNRRCFNMIKIVNCYLRQEAEWKVAHKFRTLAEKKY